MTSKLTHAIILYNSEIRKADCASSAAFASLQASGTKVVCFNFSGIQDDILFEGDGDEFICHYVRPFNGKIARIFKENVGSRRQLADILTSIITKGCSGWKYWGQSYGLGANPYSSAALWGGLAGREFEGFVCAASVGSGKIRNAFRRRALLPDYFLVNLRSVCVHPGCIHDNDLLRKYVREARLGKKSLLGKTEAGAYDFLCGCLDDSPKEVGTQKIISYLSYISMKKFGSMDFTTIGLNGTARIAVIAREKYSLDCEEIGKILQISKRDAASLLALGYSLKDKAWGSPAGK